MRCIAFPLICAALVVASWSLVEARVLYYPAGEHKLEEIKSEEDHLVIKGDGTGVTILYVKGGILVSGKEPRLSGFTLVGEGKGTGITLKNCRRALVNDVEIQRYELGLLSLCDYGERQWLHTYRDLYVYEGPEGSQKSYDARIRGVELKYTGKKSEDGKWQADGGFSNSHTFFGGRIAVPGTPLFIDGPSDTALFGTYIDMQAAPIRMTARSPGLQLFGVRLDRNRRARQANIPMMVLEKPEFNRVKIYGQHVGLSENGLIIDGTGKSVNRNHIYISPNYY